MTEIAEILARRCPLGPRYIIDPVAFFVALIGGPLLFTFATFWLLFIPVIALALGGPVYLVIGTPMLLFWLARHDAVPAQIAGLALMVLVIPLSLIFVAGLALFGPGTAPQIMQYLIFGAIFAPCWGASFAWLYRALRRDFYSLPISA